MRTKRNQIGFTLIELIASMVVIGTIAAVAAPLIAATSDAYVSASNNRDDAERLSHAMDRAIVLLREAPPTAPGSGVPDIDTALTDHIVFGNGAALELIGTTLWLTPPGGAPAPLCQGVTLFEITYLAQDGRTDTIGSPEQAQRFTVRIAAGDQELRCAVLCRIAMGGAG